MSRLASSLGAVAVVAAALALGACTSPAARPPSAMQERFAQAAQSAARHMQRGQFEAARGQYANALATAQALQDDALIGAMHLNLTLVHTRLGDAPAAQAQVQRVLDDPLRFTGGLQNRAAARKALLHLDDADLAGALHWAARAEQACSAPCAVVAAMANLRAHIALQQGDGHAAAAQAARALAAAEAQAQASEQAQALRLLGQAHSALGQDATANTALQRALALHRQLGQPDGVAAALLALADHARRQGRSDEARGHLERALEVRLALGQTAAADALRARLRAGATAR